MDRPHTPEDKKIILQFPTTPKKDRTLKSVLK